MQSTSSPQRHSRLSLFVAGFFQLQLEELPRVALMFLYSLFAVGAFIVGRILQDALLLTLPKTQGKDMILTLIGVSAVVVSISTYFYSKFAHTLRRDWMIIRINIVLAIATLFLYSLLVLVPHSVQFLVIYINYTFVEVMGSLQVILFWTLASELFNPRAAKRSFAIIGGGAVLANLLAFGVRPMVALLGGAHHLLVLLVVMLVLCLWVVRRIGQQNEPQLEQLFTQKQHQAKASSKGQAQIKVGADTERIWSNRQLATIAMVIFVTFSVSTMINYLFKSVNADTFVNDPNGLANFLGMFYGCSGILACIVQFGFANRVLQRAGIRVALLLLPIALLFGGLALASAPLLLSLFWASTLTKGSENVLRYTINDVSLNLLYVPIDSRLRARAKAFIDGILKPSSVALSAAVCALLSYIGWNEREFSILVVALLLVWVWLIFRAHREYIATLVKSMQTRRLDLSESQFAIQDESAFKALRGVLATGDTQQVLHALELLPHVPNVQWQKELLALLARDDSQVQVAALRLLSRLERQPPPAPGEHLSRDDEALLRENQALEQRLYSLIKEGEGEVRARAIETLCSLRQEEAVPDVMPHLDATSMEVQAAAIVGLVRHTGLDGMLYAAEHLRRLLEHEEPARRRIGAQVVGRLGSPTFYRPLQRLLQDEDAKVRLASIKAAGALRSPQLLNGLVEALNEPRVGMEAARALVLYGEDVLPRLQPLFLVHDAPLQQICAVRVCRDIGGQEALDTLALAQVAPRRSTRVAACKAMQRIVRREPQLRPAPEKIRLLLMARLELHHEWGARRAVLEVELRHSGALVDAVDERIHQTMEEIFLLLDLLYPGQQCNLIYHHLLADDARLRSNAIELLDNFIEQDVRRSLLPLLERELTSLDSKELHVPPSLESVLEHIAEDPSAWMQSALLWSIGLNRLTHLRPLVDAGRTHPAPIVRETAYVAMKGLVPRVAFKAALEAGCHDESQQVARYVRYQLQQLESLALSSPPSPTAPVES